MRKKSIDDFGMAGDTPAFGPMTSTVSGAAIGPALDDLGGPLLGKQAAMQFEVMDKKAQAEILSDPAVPLMAKISLALHHTKLSNQAKIKLAHHILNSVPVREKRAFMGKMLGMMGRGLKAMKPGFGNSAALQGQLRSLGGVANVRNNLGVMGQMAQAGKQLPVLRHAPSGLGKFPTLTMPKSFSNPAATAGRSMPGGASSVDELLGKRTATMGGGAPSVKTTGPMDETLDMPTRPRSQPVQSDPNSIFPDDPLKLDESDLTALGRGSKPSFGSYPNQSNATQLSPSELVNNGSSLSTMGTQAPHELSSDSLGFWDRNQRRWLNAYNGGVVPSLSALQ